MMLKMNLILLRILFVTCICLPGNELLAQEQINNPESGKIRVASCQFPVSSNIRENFSRIREQIIESKLNNIKQNGKEKMFSKL